MEVEGGKRESCDETDYNKLAAVLCCSRTHRSEFGECPNCTGYRQENFRFYRAVGHGGRERPAALSW